jgi:hypothetical protein
VACNKLTENDGKACNNIPAAVNKLALSARLGHSCETGWNKHDSSDHSKQNSKVYHRVKFELYYLQVYDKQIVWLLGVRQQCNLNAYICRNLLFYW